MAYASTVTIVPTITAGNAAIVLRPGTWIRVRIAETECANSSEATIPLLGPFFGRIHAQRCDKTAGAGATVDPILGTATAPSGVEIVAENGTPADPVNNAPVGGVPFYTADGNLYHRSQPASGTDNTITTEYIIEVVG